jgi:sulfide:quinone oxidoreductase
MKELRNILILGAGTAGTIMANRLRKKLDPSRWGIQIVDEHPDHYYQPGFLFMPFGVYTEKDVAKPKRRFIPSGVQYVEATVERIDAETNRVRLADGSEMPYDALIIATGTQPAPAQTEGLEGGDWRKRVHEFYTFEGARALTTRLRDWKGGRLVVHISELPIKCPVAPLEFAFLADSWLRRRGLRDQTELVYVTPLAGAFTKPIASGILGHLLAEKRIRVVNDFNVARLDNDRHKLVSWDEQEVEYDLLVTVPVNTGAAMVERSGLGDELNYVPTDKHTLQSRQRENIFVIGDATDLPTSKAGSVAHFAAEALTENILSFLRGQPLPARFDGHANCFIGSGDNQAVLLDFNYHLEPVPGKFPFPALGPLELLGESRLNHWSKLAFRWAYWNLLLKARPLPFVTHQMGLAGKKVPAGLLKTEAPA